jgi:hypothetical protein
MTYEALVNIFKAAAATYVPVLPNTKLLQFHYDSVWYNNAEASNDYPSMLFECSPDFELKGYQANNRTGLQTFKGKLFFYDTFWEGERAVKDVFVKQSELNELALQTLGEIKRRADLVPLQIMFGSGFFGKDVHNPKLVQVYIPFTVTLKSDCTPLPS